MNGALRFTDDQSLTFERSVLAEGREDLSELRSNVRRTRAKYAGKMLAILSVLSCLRC